MESFILFIYYFDDDAKKVCSFLLVLETGWLEGKGMNSIKQNKKIHIKHKKFEPYLDWMRIMLYVNSFLIYDFENTFATAEVNISRHFKLISLPFCVFYFVTRPVRLHDQLLRT